VPGGQVKCRDAQKFVDVFFVALSCSKCLTWASAWVRHQLSMNGGYFGRPSHRNDAAVRTQGRIDLTLCRFSITLDPPSRRSSFAGSPAGTAVGSARPG
jgi:hypothetical protein